MNVPSELNARGMVHVGTTDEDLIRQLHGIQRTKSKLIAELTEYQTIMLRTNLQDMQNYAHHQRLLSARFPLDIERANIDFGSHWSEQWDRKQTVLQPTLSCSWYHNGKLGLAPLPYKETRQLRQMPSRKSMSFRKSFNLGSRKASMKDGFLQRRKSVDISSPKSKAMMQSRHFNTLFQDYKTDSIQEALLRSMTITLGLHNTGLNKLEELVELCGRVKTESDYSLSAFDDHELFHQIQNLQKKAHQKVMHDHLSASPVSQRDTPEGFSSFMLREEKKLYLMVSLEEFALTDDVYRQITDGILKLYCPCLNMPSMSHIVRNDVSFVEIMDEGQEKEFWDDFHSWALNPGYEWFSDIPITSYLMWILQYMQKVERLVMTRIHTDLEQVYSCESKTIKKGSGLSVYRFFADIPQVEGDDSSLSLGDIRHESGSYASSTDKRKDGHAIDDDDEEEMSSLNDNPSHRVRPRSIGKQLFGSMSSINSDTDSTKIRLAAIAALHSDSMDSNSDIFRKDKFAAEKPQTFSKAKKEKDEHVSYL
jgi:hypothetical protein